MYDRDWTDDDIKEFNKNKDQFLINRKNLTIDFDVVLGKGASSTVQKGFLKGRSPLLNLEDSLKCQQYQDCDVAVKVASTLGQIEATRWMQEIEAIKRLGYNEYIVSDFGLCCDLDRDTLTYQASLTKRLPIKWLSIEALTERRFSEKSDVWSFGILMYEMFSLGKEPYVSLQNHEIISFLSHGNRLERFEEVPDKINQIMGSCWENDSAQRPTFENLILQFRNILEESTKSYGYVQ
uniref:Protein kinase domain-containing protein n=1 Tax=Acrobeloides nanus TaxID=290746 RepID=A0A914C8I0_9BILA